MELLRYILAVAVGAFVAGVGCVSFIDNRIETKLKEQKVLHNAEVVGIKVQATGLYLGVEGRQGSANTKGSGQNERTQVNAEERFILESAGNK